MDDVYKLEQYHCHWGCSDSRGSEHTVDGQAFAGEVQNISNEIIISSQSVAFIRTFGTVRSANQILTTQTSAIIPMIAKAVYQQFISNPVTSSMIHSLRSSTELMTSTLSENRRVRFISTIILPRINRGSSLSYQSPTTLL